MLFNFVSILKLKIMQKNRQENHRIPTEKELIVIKYNNSLLYRCVLCLGMTYSLDFRERAVAYVRDGGSQAACCRAFKIDRKTLYHWLQAKELRPKQHGLRQRKLDKSALAADVRDYPDSFLRERAARFGVSTQAIWQALRQLEIRKKNDALR